MELSLQNPNLLGDRKLLLEAARKKLDESGYSYRKGKSRSKRLSSDGDGSSVSKRAKINAEYRLSRIDELKDKIKDLSEQLHYKNLRRVAAENVHNYKECDKLTEQMSTLKHERHTLELELKALTKKQKKAEWYLTKKAIPLKVSPPQNNLMSRPPSSSPEPRSSSGSSVPPTPVSCSSISSSPSLSEPPTSMCLSSQLDVCTSQDSDGTVQLSEESSDVPQPVHPLYPLLRQDALQLDHCTTHDSCDTASHQQPDNFSSLPVDQHFL